MTIQQWLFSSKGRIGRRDFWIWIGPWFAGMLTLLSLTDKNLFDIQTAVFRLVCSPWPTVVVAVKRLHDRRCFGAWAFLMIVAWVLLAGNWAILPGVWQRVVGRFVPTLILVMMLVDLGAFVGTQDENKYGEDTQDVKYKADNKPSNQPLIYLLSLFFSGTVISTMQVIAPGKSF